MKTDCLTCGKNRMLENGECGPCAEARRERVFEDIRQKRAEEGPNLSGQTGLGDFS